MLETEGNEENKEDNEWILVLVIPVSMKEQVPLGVSVPTCRDSLPSPGAPGFC
jgi:hypothetical protein